MKIAPDARPLVTALVVNYNYGRFLREALDSALGQTYPRVEVVVIDDGSTDESRDVLRGYGDRIRTILKPNGGQASGLNVGIEAAKGELICFLDSDDVWAPEKVAAVVEKYRAGSFGLVCHALAVFHEKVPGAGADPGPGTPAELPSGEIFPDLARRALPWVFSATSAMSVPADLARRIAPIPEAEWRICADNPLAYGAAYLAPVGAIERPLGYYRVHGQNAFAVEGPALDALGRIWSIVHPRQRLRYLETLAAREGRPLGVDLCADYRYLRDWCFLATPFPLAHLPRLWKRNVEFRRETGDGWGALALSLVKDAIIAGIISLRVPSRYLPLRRRYREFVDASSPNGRAAR